MNTNDYFRHRLMPLALSALLCGVTALNAATATLERTVLPAGGGAAAARLPDAVCVAAPRGAAKPGLYIAFYRGARTLFLSGGQPRAPARPQTRRAPSAREPGGDPLHKVAFGSAGPRGGRRLSI